MKKFVSELLTQLIDIPSPTGDEGQLSVFLEKYLQDAGLVVQTWKVDETRNNVFASIGKPRIILQAHMDVVPPHIPASEDDEFIYGRGACDTKGSIAAMLTAAEEARNAGKTDFGLLFTVGEEVDFAGAKQAAQSIQDLDTFMVVGEPTQLSIVNAHYGILAVDIVCKGKAAHSSEPQRGINTIEILLATLNRIVDEIKVSPGTLFSIVKVQGGIADNIIPSYAQATLSFRIAPDDKRDYREVLRRIIGENATLENELFLAPVASMIPNELSALGPGSTAKYCTELSFFKNGIVCGPGNIADAHTDGERVSKKELEQAVEVYRMMIESY